MIRLAIAVTGATGLMLLLATAVLAYDGIDVKVETWSSDNGHGYVGVKANGEWTPPAETRTRVRTTYYSEWQNQGQPGRLLPRLVGLRPSHGRRQHRQLRQP